MSGWRQRAAVLVAVVGLAGCGGASTAADIPSPPPSTTTPAPTAAPEPPESEAFERVSIVSADHEYRPGNEFSAGEGLGLIYEVELAPADEEVILREVIEIVSPGQTVERDISLLVDVVDGRLEPIEPLDALPPSESTITLELSVETTKGGIFHDETLEVTVTP